MSLPPECLARRDRWRRGFVDSVAVVEQEVRQLVRRRGLDPAVDAPGIRRLVDEVIADYDERSLTSALPPLADRRATARSVYDAVAGFGPLQPYLDDPEIEEIRINDRLNCAFQDELCSEASAVNSLT